jgi:hypothetical protein
MTAPTFNPWAVGLLALGGVYLYSRAHAKPTPKQKAVMNGSQTYSTPTAVAAALGAFVSAYTRGATPTVPATDNIVGFNWKPWSENAVQAGKDWSAANPSLGVFTFGDGMPNVDAAWSARPSFVNAPASDGSSVDSLPLGAVYDITTGFQRNAYDFSGG